MKLLVGVVIMILFTLSGIHVARASPVLISQLQPGDALSALNESTEIYNNTASDQDITNWCLKYSAASSISFSGPRYCFTPSDVQTKLFLSAQSYASIVTVSYAMPDNIAPDGRFIGSGMSGTGGNMKLLDMNSDVIDALGWGTSTLSEGFSVINVAPSAPSASQALWRKVSGSTLQDTDNNKADIELKTPGLRTGGVYEVRTPIDICALLPGVQEAMPEGYGYDEAGNCELLEGDVCTNIALIQLNLPTGFLLDSDGGCYSDSCDNLGGLQRDVPRGYLQSETHCIRLETAVILLNEIMPNVSGADTGKEFIELYNPNEREVNLAGYRLQIGKNYEQDIVLGGTTTDLLLPAHGFITFSDEALGYTLLNTTDSLRILTPAGDVVSQTTYNTPADDESWAYINDGWQYTDQPTPNAANIASLAISESTIIGGSVNSLQPCGPGKYRNILTNRCRNIETDAAVLASCDSDEYRNPDSGRCRKIATLAEALTVCSAGYERNIDTNRCRKMTAAVKGVSTCKIGYERNLDTNRCRKVTPEVVAQSPAHAPDGQTALLQTSLMATTAVGAVGYGLYEWRSEMLRVIGRLIALVSGK
jgi:hypothetical protein